MANTVTLAPVQIYKEFWVYGASSPYTSNATPQFLIAPSADVTDTLGAANNRWATIYCNNIVVGNSTVSSNAAGNGFVVLPGGIMMQWGTGTANTVGNTVTFPQPFAVNCFSFHVTESQANVTTGTANTTKGVVTASAGTPTFFWLAIGQ